MFYDVLIEKRAQREEDQRSGIGGYVAGAPFALAGAYSARSGLQQPKKQLTLRDEKINADYSAKINKLNDEITSERAIRSAKRQQAQARFSEMLSAELRRAAEDPNGPENVLDALKEIAENVGARAVSNGPKMDPSSLDEIIGDFKRHVLESDVGRTGDLIRQLSETELARDDALRKSQAKYQRAYKAAKGTALARTGVGLAAGYGAKKLYDMYNQPKKQRS
jgi:hypothetical protein